jgi:hypothetical protein
MFIRDLTDMKPRTVNDVFAVLAVLLAAASLPALLQIAGALS